MIYNFNKAGDFLLFIQILNRCNGCQFLPECHGHFAPESIVTLLRNRLSLYSGTECQFAPE